MDRIRMLPEKGAPIHPPTGEVAAQVEGSGVFHVGVLLVYEVLAVLSEEPMAVVP